MPSLPLRVAEIDSVFQQHNPKINFPETKKLVFFQGAGSSLYL